MVAADNPWWLRSQLWHQLDMDGLLTQRLREDSRTASSHSQGIGAWCCLQRYAKNHFS